MKSDTENIEAYLRKMFLNFCQIVFDSENIAVNNDFFRRFMLNHSDWPIGAVSRRSSTGSVRRVWCDGDWNQVPIQLLPGVGQAALFGI